MTPTVVHGLCGKIHAPKKARKETARTLTSKGSNSNKRLIATGVEAGFEPRLYACENCGAPFERPSHGRRKIFCCNECRLYAWEEKRERETRNEHSQGVLENSRPSHSVLGRVADVASPASGGGEGKLSGGESGSDHSHG